MREIETCWLRLKAEAIVVGVAHPASIASDVESKEWINNVRPVGLTKIRCADDDALRKLRAAGLKKMFSRQAAKPPRKWD